MPEELKTEPTEAEKAEKAAIDRIAAGVVAGVNAATPKIVEAAAAARPVETPAPVATLIRPTSEAVIEAVAIGDKALAARLMDQQRTFDQQENQRALGTITRDGSAAIASIARAAAKNLKYYSRFQKEIDASVDKYVAQTGVVPTLEMYEQAHTLALGRHHDELEAETKEETIRKSREPAPELTPEGRRAAPEEVKPTNLKEALAPDRYLFDQKLRSKNGRSEEAELKAAGFKGFDDFMVQRENNLRVVEETNSGMHLDQDWACKAHGRKFCSGCSRAGAEGEWV